MTTGPGDTVGPVARDGRRGPTRYLAAAVAAGLVAALLVATAAGFRYVQSDPLPVVPPGPVLTLDVDAGDWPTGRVGGTLLLRGGCLLVDDRVALFPAGTRWSDADRAVRLADGRRWRPGDRLAGSGAELAVESLPTAAPGAQAATACARDLGLPGAVLVRP